MKKLLILVVAALFPLAAMADEVAAAAEDEAGEAAPLRGTPAEPFDGAEISLDDFLWTARPVVVFANSEADPAFQRQLELLRERPDPLAEREVVVIVDTDTAEPSSVRLRLRPRGFMLVIMGKDGQVITRKPSPWDVREISRAIDRTPLRQQEVRERGSVTR